MTFFRTPPPFFRTEAALRNSLVSKMCDVIFYPCFASFAFFAGRF